MGPLTPLLSQLLRVASIPLAMTLLAPSAAAIAQSPCGDANALIEAIRTVHGNGRFLWTGGVGAFFPKDSHYDGSQASSQSDRVFFTVTRGGEEVGRSRLLANGDESVFQRFQPIGSSPVLDLTQAGEYRVSYGFEGKAVTTLPFTVSAEGSDDPFNPATTYTVDAPILHMAQIHASRTSAQGKAEALYYLRGGDLVVPKGEEAIVSVEKDGRRLFDAGKLRISMLPKPGEWRRYNPSIVYGKEKGGGFLELDDFLRIDGTYWLTIRLNGEVKKAWSFEIKNQQLVPHPRSSFKHQPRTEYLLSRIPMERYTGHTEITWIEPVRDLGVTPAAATTSGVAVDPAARALWYPAVSAPARATSLVTTSVSARVDAGLAAGDGIVAYGTGPNTGVAYLRCGEDVEVSLPNGAKLSSKTFFACGKKLVLLNGKSVVVHDTVSGKSVEVPAGDVTLAGNPRGLSKGGPIAADGMLVAVLTDTREVADRATVKVIDVSGELPTVISLGFPDAEPNQLASIGVDAEAGVVVVGSDRKNGLFVAPIATGADFRFHDLSGHDGFPRDCAPIVRGGRAAVFDSTGTRKLRLVDLESGAVQTIMPLAKAERWFAFDGDRVALASNQSNGSEYQIVMGPADGSAPGAPGGSGDSFGSGKLGYGQTVAMAGDLLFACGAGPGGIGRAEVLYVTDGSSWTAATVGGERVPAVDATCGQHLVAFKTGKSRDARIAYVLLGASSAASELAQ